MASITPTPSVAVAIGAPFTSTPTAPPMAPAIIGSLAAAPTVAPTVAPTAVPTVALTVAPVAPYAFKYVGSVDYPGNDIVAIDTTSVAAKSMTIASTLPQCSLPTTLSCGRVPGLICPATRSLGTWAPHSSSAAPRPGASGSAGSSLPPMATAMHRTGSSSQPSCCSRRRAGRCGRLLCDRRPSVLLSLPSLRVSVRISYATTSTTSPTAST